MTLRVIQLGMFAATWMSLVAIGSARQSDSPPTEPHEGIQKIEADAAQGYHWPYLLYVPATVRDADREQVHSIAVIPNNTGIADDDHAVHEKRSYRSMEQARQLGDQIGVVVLQPIFPRPSSDWRIYTHALDRDSLLTDMPELRRLDQQLLAMIDHAAGKLKSDGVNTQPRVLIMGFSASGMFANRFTFLHPERVKAAIIGSPGGWPIAPVRQFNDQDLRYPIGIADLDSIAGKPCDLPALAQVPMLVYLGDQDENDSVIFRDSYEEEDETLIRSLFGDTPVARWPHAEKLYREHLPLATFKLYPGVGHEINADIIQDLIQFLAQHAK